jgi:hypothetical protein
MNENKEEVHKSMNDNKEEVQKSMNEMKNSMKCIETILL